MLGDSHLHLLSRLDRNIQLHLRGWILPLDPVHLLAVVPDSVGDLAQRPHLHLLALCQVYTLLVSVGDSVSSVFHRAI